MHKCVVSRYASAYADRQLCLQNKHEWISAEVDHLQQHVFVRTYMHTKVRTLICMYGSILYNTFKYALHECIDVLMPIVSTTSAISP